MDQPSKADELLDDLLADTNPAEFRAAVLNQTVRCARRRRTAQGIRRASTIVAVMIFATILVWRAVAPSSSLGRDRGYARVETAQLPPINLVRTIPGLATSISSDSAGVAVVQTGSIAREYRLISDEQLLALAGSKRAVLVKVAPHASELIFVSDDERSAAEHQPL